LAAIAVAACCTCPSWSEVRPIESALVANKPSVRANGGSGDGTAALMSAPKMFAMVWEYCALDISRARNGESLSSGPRPTLPEQEMRQLASSAIAPAFTTPALNVVLFFNSTLRQPEDGLCGTGNSLKKFHQTWKSGRKIQERKHYCIHSRIGKINCNSQVSA
jgi:hypothetical protein